MAYDISRLEQALVNADKAGDVEAAKVIAAEIRKQRAVSQSPQTEAQTEPLQQKPSFTDEVVRQAGSVIARPVLEGLGNVADLVTLPLRAAYGPVASALGLPQAATDIGKRTADAVGLPEPANAHERLAGNVAGLMTGTGATIKAAGALAGGGGEVTKRVLNTMASRPDMQMVSAAGAGTAGGMAKEADASPVAQFLAALAGGVAAPVAAGGAQRLGSGLKSLWDNLRGSPNLNAQIDLAIENAVGQGGLKLSDLSGAVREQLRSDIRDAVKTGNLSEDALRRLADYRLIGAVPTRASITLDPAMVTQQKNLAKMGMNSRDPELQRLGQIENTNNSALIENLNTLGAGTKDDAVSMGQKVLDALRNKDKAAKEGIDALYAQARDTQGRSASLSPGHFAQRANDLLDEALLGGKLPSDVRSKLNDIATGKSPLTVDVAVQLKSRLAELQRNTFDLAEKKSLGLVRQALEETPLLDKQGQAALDAFAKGSTAHKAWMKVVENTPALQAARENLEPDKFIQKFVVGNTDDASTKALFMLSQQLKGSPEALSVVRNAFAKHLKGAAINQQTDEVGKFSQSAYNRALSAIGDRKLAMFFSPQEVAQLKAVGRVASYEQIQPKGSAVNNSNTATALAGSLLDKIVGVSKLGGVMVGNPVASIKGHITAKKATDVSKALLDERPELRGVPPVLLPLLLSAEQ